MAAIFGEGKIFWKLPRVHCSDTLWVENFDEIALSRTVQEIEANLCFAIFGKNSKWPPFLGRGNFFWKLPSVHCSDTLWVKNFDEIALSRTVKEIEANLCFAIFGKNSKNSKWPPFLGRGKFFWKLPRVHCLDTLWVENFDEIALPRTVKAIEVNLFFSHFWQKYENSKWPPFLGRGKFLKIAKSTLLRYPVGQKFRQNRSISHG